MTQYRARGHYIPTGRDSWITTGWRNTREQAESDILCYARDSIYSKTWIVEDVKRYPGQSPTLRY